MSLKNDKIATRGSYKQKLKKVAWVIYAEYP